MAQRAIRELLDWWIEVQLLHDALPEGAKWAQLGTCERFEPFEPFEP